MLINLQPKYNLNTTKNTTKGFLVLCWFERILQPNVCARARARASSIEVGGMTFAEQFKAKYDNHKKPQTLPKNGAKKPILSECRSCSRFERGEDPAINWCVSKYFDRIKKRQVICYANIKLLNFCPKTVQKSKFNKKV